MMTINLPVLRELFQSFYNGSKNLKKNLTISSILNEIVWNFYDMYIVISRVKHQYIIEFTS